MLLRRISVGVLLVICLGTGCGDDPQTPDLDGEIQNEIVFVQDSADFSHIKRINADGTDLRPITGGAVRDIFPRISPDGRSVAFVRIGVSHDIYLTNPSGSEFRRLTTDETHKLSSISWSPDGTRIVFAGQHRFTSVWDIFVVDIRTGTIQNISSGIQNPTRRIYVHPDWGTNNQIIFVKNDTLFWITPEGTVIRKHAYHGSPTTPKWSPKADRIAFAFFEAADPLARSDVAWIDSVGNSFELLASHPAIDTDPAWSPSGEQIVFRSDRDGSADLFVLRPTDERIVPQNILRSPRTDWAPSWR